MTSVADGKERSCDSVAVLGWPGSAHSPGSCRAIRPSREIVDAIGAILLSGRESRTDSPRTSKEKGQTIFIPRKISRGGEWGSQLS